MNVNERKNVNVWVVVSRKVNDELTTRRLILKVKGITGLKTSGAVGEGDIYKLRYVCGKRRVS